MRFLASVLGLLALASSATAQTPTLPLQSLSTQLVSIATGTSNCDALNTVNQVVPTFSAWSQVNTRYSTEFKCNVAATIQINFSASSGQKVYIRNCVFGLRTTGVKSDFSDNNVLSNAVSQCAPISSNYYVGPSNTAGDYSTAPSNINTADQYYTTSGSAQFVRFQDLTSSAVTYFEFLFPQFIDNDVAGASQVSVYPGYPDSAPALGTVLPIGSYYWTSYLLTIGIRAAEEVGSQMYSVETKFATARFLQPHTTGAANQFFQVHYTIADPAVGPSTRVDVPFYLSSQKTTQIMFVQECPGKTCAEDAVTGCRLVDAPVNKKRLTSPADALQGFIASNSNFIYNAANMQQQHGSYVFPAVIGHNCLRFINQAQATGSVNNDQTITIYLNVLNCNTLSCQNCVNNARCGYCLNSQFNVNDGACKARVVHVLTFFQTGNNCLAWPINDAINTPRFLAINAAVQCTTVLRGDPRITGLQGQDFQVHGTPNEYFNLVSTPTLQVNSRFVYLEDGKCDNFTACFSHPGTYIDEIGVMMGENKIRVVAGALSEATRVFINGKEVQVSAHKHTVGQMTVTFANARRAVVKTPEYMMTISQSDKFFNVDSALLKTELLDQGSKLVKLESSRATEANTFMHGLIGQTWRNNVYAGDREYEGEVSDYLVQDGLWGKDFAFNLYK